MEGRVQELTRSDTAGDTNGKTGRVGGKERKMSKDES